MSLINNANGLIKKYIKLLDDYRGKLEDYQKNLTEAQNKIEHLNVTEEDKMAAVQVALDLTYLKEELDVMRPSQEQMAADLVELRNFLNALQPQQNEIAEKIGKIDNTIIEPIKKNYTANKNAIMEKLDEVVNGTKKSNTGLKIALGFSLFFNVLSVSGLIFIICYLLEIIRL